jgi:hypothetical protein
LAEDLFRLLPVLEDFARRNDCDVILFPDRYEKKYNRNIYGLKQMISERYRLSSSPVNVFVSAAIEDFMREISAATWIVTNSYHALMFSVIYKRNIRIIVPTDNIRKGMHARMQEFADSIIGGPLMQSDMLEALASFERGETITFNEEELTKRIQYSRDWLKRQIRDIADGKNR